MMNATGKIRVFINEQDYSDFLVEGSISDESAYSTNIITTTGTMKFAGSSDILDFDKTKFPVGSHVSIFITLSNGKLAKMPRGSLLILSSTIDVKEPSITFDLGCTLSYISAREGSYQTEIAGLIDTFVPTEIKESFVVEQKDLTTLNNLLDIAGLVIFQNGYGTIQKANKFGNDGIGGDADTAKMTCFDKFTTIDVESLGGAIEDLPSEILVTSTTEIPVFSRTGPQGTQDNTDEVFDGKPPPFVTSQTRRTILIPDALKLDTFFEVQNLPNQPESQTETLPSCGSVSDPDSTPSSYGYTVTGRVVAIEKEYQENVTQGSYTSYKGPGNQVDFEYDFEYCSAGTYARGLLTGLLNKHVEGANTEKQEAQALCGKVNQAFTQRDDFTSRPKTVVYFYDEDAETGVRTLRSTELSEESTLNANAAKYYACVGQEYLKAARAITQGAARLAQKATSAVDTYLRQYGYSNFNTTEYFYDRSGTLTHKITKNYIHPASSDAAQKATNALEYIKNPAADHAKYAYEVARGDFDFEPFRDVKGTPFTDVIRGDSLLQSHSNTIKDPTSRFNLFLSRTTTTRYVYSNLYVEEIVEVEDHENPINSYKQTNFSSTGSKNPSEPDRIEIQRDSSGNILNNYQATNGGISEQETKTVELKSRQALKLTGAPTNVQSRWLGQPGPQTKELTLPMSFAPIVQRYSSAGSALGYNPQATLSRYQKILSRYAINEAKKIAADNSGFRVTEIGTRAELFGYYPYFPIALNLSRLGKRYGLKASSSSWVFDRDNILCSIDCFTTSEITSESTQDEISPFIYTRAIKVEGTTTITPLIINIASTATQIRVLTLPQLGTLALSGSAVLLNDVINVSDIQAGNLVFTPLTSDTTQVSFSYEALDANGSKIGSGDGIFPADQYEFLENVFADAGEFTDNTSDGGVSAGGGDFDLGTRPGGNYSLDAGNFDTGAAIPDLEPLPSGIGNQQNGEADVESDYGANVVDDDGNTIGTDQLPSPDGDNQGLLEIEIDFDAKTFSLLSITSEIILQLGWDYGFTNVDLGTPIDNGTITTPINYNLDFGTITTPLTPALTSSVS